MLQFVVRVERRVAQIRSLALVTLIHSVFLLVRNFVWIVFFFGRWGIGRRGRKLGRRVGSSGENFGELVDAGRVRRSGDNFARIGHRQHIRWPKIRAVSKRGGVDDVVIGVPERVGVVTRVGETVRSRRMHASSLSVPLGLRVGVLTRIFHVFVIIMTSIE